VLLPVPNVGTDRVADLDHLIGAPVSGEDLALRAARRNESRVLAAKLVIGDATRAREEQGHAEDHTELPEHPAPFQFLSGARTPRRSTTAGCVRRFPYDVIGRERRRPPLAATNPEPRALRAAGEETIRL